MFNNKTHIRKNEETNKNKKDKSIKIVIEKKTRDTAQGKRGYGRLWLNEDTLQIRWRFSSSVIVTA